MPLISRLVRLPKAKYCWGAMGRAGNDGYHRNKEHPHGRRAEGPECHPPLASPQTLLGLIHGNWTPQVLYVAAQLGLADLLADGPKSGNALV